MSASKRPSIMTRDEVAFADKPTTGMNTGSWKSVEPRYEDQPSPCSQSCPAGNDISQVMLLLAAGDTTGAARVLREGNPLPATLGRVCPHPCEGKCNRQQLGGAISINQVERFLGDLSLAAALAISQAPKTGKKVAVIGAGPAGISAAYALALRGHDVMVLDDKPKAGGYLRTGIPDYRLPKSILDREIALVENLCVTFKQNTRVGKDISVEAIAGQVDALVVAVGLHRSRSLALPSAGKSTVINGVDLLERITLGHRPELPERLAIIGGGNTAMDVARSVLRLGKKPVVVYRRTEAEMPAIASEVEDAKREGVEFVFLATPMDVVTDKGNVVGLTCQKMKLGEPDPSGRRAPIPIPDSEFRIPVSGVINATGESADLDFVAEEIRTSDWFFLAGDAATNEGTVTGAVGDGRRIADLVDGYLRTGVRERQKPNMQTLWRRKVTSDRNAGSESINTAYFAVQPRPEIQTLTRTHPIDFAEVEKGVGLNTAVAEAQRCIVCGTCNHCLNCYYWCPDIAIHKHEGTLRIESMHCKGCGICVEECPRGAMNLGEVSR